MLVLARVHRGSDHVFWDLNVVVHKDQLDILSEQLVVSHLLLNILTLLLQLLVLNYLRLQCYFDVAFQLLDNVLLGFCLTESRLLFFLELFL